MWDVPKAGAKLVTAGLGQVARWQLRLEYIKLYAEGKRNQEEHRTSENAGRARGEAEAIHPHTHLLLPHSQTLYNVSRPFPTIDEVRVKASFIHSQATYIDSGESPPDTR